ncbi:hypothetical protein MPTK1_8g07690 [Marchantia polymorpha subsp. ruderalis]|uniref:Uncharacterized protein n=1 Tax=Marchantia polymorpha TaxID=3197 RepID=A0A2R6XI36_MARPO|nr:hypothetical protein MARPO_0013s0026 [Marchantia polymorpha]BBN19078.1 hypothetical protein Mp_8g07690 [Marchantia polymorpha subsp. ruderalis]|eukprot:PTQ45768.1 hypothetical protein MARPO_0013s0026 [Marchantia polymorpha]
MRGLICPMTTTVQSHSQSKRSQQVGMKKRYTSYISSSC